MSVTSDIELAPGRYAEAAFLARMAGEEMISRLDWMTLQPAVVLDTGCGTGEMSALLRARYPQASIISLDWSDAMLAYAQQAQRQGHYLCADAHRLPFADQSIQLVFANFLLPWVADPSRFLMECKRVLAPDGLLMLNALGPDTLQAWQAVLDDGMVPHRMDMHDLGDLLLKTGFLDPVVDVNTYTATYQDSKRFFTELQASEFWLPDQPLPAAVQPGGNNLVHEWYTEIIFAHAFAPQVASEVSLTAGVASIPLSSLRRQLRK